MGRSGGELSMRGRHGALSQWFPAARTASRRRDPAGGRSQGEPSVRAGAVASAEDDRTPASTGDSHAAAPGDTHRTPPGPRGIAELSALNSDTRAQGTGPSAAAIGAIPSSIEACLAQMSSSAVDRARRFDTLRPAAGSVPTLTGPDPDPGRCPATTPNPRHPEPRSADGTVQRVVPAHAMDTLQAPPLDRPNGPRVARSRKHWNPKSVPRLQSARLAANGWPR